MATHVKDSPGKVALDFANAYFQLDRSMSDLICMEYRKVGDNDAVDEYIQSLAEKARERGFGRSFMKNKLFHMKTKIDYHSNAEADVRITGERSRYAARLDAFSSPISRLAYSRQVSIKSDPDCTGTPVYSVKLRQYSGNVRPP